MQSHAGPRTLPPLPGVDRVFGLWEHTALWFSLGVGLLVIQVGAFLVPALGTRAAAGSILAGSVIGAGLLAWVGRMGCASGLSSAGLIEQTYGSSFARLPIFLNVIQLAGWATFELVIMRDGTRAIIQRALAFDPGTAWPTLLWGILVFVLVRGSMLTLVRRIVSRLGLPLVVLSLIWLTVQFTTRLNAGGLQALWAHQGDGSMNFFQAIDLVVAMPVSWLPLVADYARHGRDTRSTFAGTWLGYALANIWCYALGVLVITVIGPDTELLGALLLAQGGLLALGLILIDELDNTYGDLYSGSVCLHSLLPRHGRVFWASALAGLSMAAAMILPMHSLEPFLLALSSVFVPLFGTILGARGLSRDAAEHHLPTAAAAAIWLVGIVVYHTLAQWAPQLGSAMPTLLLTFLLAKAGNPFGTVGKQISGR